MEKQKVIEALLLIQEICKGNGCDTCPFRDAYDGDDCYITSVNPISWVIAEKEKEWRAFE